MVRFLLIGACLAFRLPAQADDPPAASAHQSKRIFGIIPNYKTVPDLSQSIEPITPHEKFKLAAQDTFDPYTFVLAGAYAGVSQWQNQARDFGQGSAGFAKRFGASYADQAIGNYMTEAIGPSLMKQDPRYFRLAHGNFFKRTGYALTRVLITRQDTGARAFNYSEILGNESAAAISNLYYPARDRTVSETVRKGAVLVLTDATFNVLKEFWPDIRHKVFGK